MYTVAEDAARCLPLPVPHAEAEREIAGVKGVGHQQSVAAGSRVKHEEELRRPETVDGEAPLE
jgi:hypothetical protein